MDTSDGRQPQTTRVHTPYAHQIRALSDRLVEAQRPIRILDAVQWGDAVEWAFFANGARELPPVGPDSYLKRPLPFAPADKAAELRDLERDVRRQLGVHDAPGRILIRMCEEYRDAVAMLAHRGTASFVAASRRLYGSAGERFGPDGGSLLAAGRGLAQLALCHAAPPEGEATLDAPTSVAVLSQRLRSYFADTPVRVQLSDGIVADAAAGCDYIKLRRDACFTPSDLRVLEVHEGWVHLGTTLNGQRQPVCTFLSKGPPSSTITQEGLAVLTEVVTLAAHPARVRRLVGRLEGVALAEAGANFLEVYAFFLAQGCGPRESYQQTMRIFRGSLPDGCGPFTKDICYSKGFLLVSEFLRKPTGADLGSLLFCGKTCLSDLDDLAQLVAEGLVAPPRFVPAPFMRPRPCGDAPPAANPMPDLTFGERGALAQ